jgi:hypothetical protein
MMDQLYTLTGSKMKAFFILSKGAAASEAFYNYQLAAAKAVGQTGIFGIPMQTYFQALSYIVPPMIMASAFTGPSGGSASAGNVDITATTPASSPTPAPAPVQESKIINNHFYGVVDADQFARKYLPAFLQAQDDGVTING